MWPRVRNLALGRVGLRSSQSARGLSSRAGGDSVAATGQMPTACSLQVGTAGILPALCKPRYWSLVSRPCSKQSDRKAGRMPAVPGVSPSALRQIFGNSRVAGTLETRDPFADQRQSACQACSGSHRPRRYRCHGEFGDETALTSTGCSRYRSRNTCFRFSNLGRSTAKI